MEHNALLQRLGLDERQSTLYLALLKHGQSTVSGIARRTGLHRPAIYQTIRVMLTNGLVEQTVRGKRRQYSAARPEHLRSILERTKQELQRAIQEWQELAKTAEARPALRYLEGKGGIRAVFVDLLHKSRRGDVFYRYSSPKDLARAERYLPQNYREVRDRKQLQRFVIASDVVAGGKRQRLDRMMKVIPQAAGLFAYDVTQIIYRDTVALIDYATETAIIIESPIIASFQIKLFTLLFERLD